jgi:hypothetical protein
VSGVMQLLTILGILAGATRNSGKHQPGPGTLDFLVHLHVVLLGFTVFGSLHTNPVLAGFNSSRI